MRQRLAEEREGSVAELLARAGDEDRQNLGVERTARRSQLVAVSVKVVPAVGDPGRMT